MHTNVKLKSFILSKTNKGEIYYLHDQKTLNVGDIPSYATHIRFGDIANVDIGMIPEGVVKIEFYPYGSVGNTIKKGSIPKSCKYLSLGKFDRLLEEILPDGIETVIVDAFNQPIESLPNSIINLNLGYVFNRKIKPFSLPKNLKKLTIANYNYNCDFEKNTLPDTLEKLTLNTNIFCRIEDPLPNLHFINLQYNIILKNFTFVPFVYLAGYIDIPLSYIDGKLYSVINTETEIENFMKCDLECKIKDELLCLPDVGVEYFNCKKEFGEIKKMM